MLTNSKSGNRFKRTWHELILILGVLATGVFGVLYLKGIGLVWCLMCTMILYRLQVAVHNHTWGNFYNDLELGLISTCIFLGAISWTNASLFIWPDFAWIGFGMIIALETLRSIAKTNKVKARITYEKRLGTAGLLICEFNKSYSARLNGIQAPAGFNHIGTKWSKVCATTEEELHFKEQLKILLWNNAWLAK